MKRKGYSMFDNRYDKNQPAVRAMANRIAENCPQRFETMANFSAFYGSEAVEMVIKGGLLAALHDLGIKTEPAAIEGEQRDQARGLHIMHVGVNN